MPTTYVFQVDEYNITIVCLGSSVANYKVFGSDAAGEAWDAACKFMEAIGGHGYLTDVQSGEVLEIYGSD